MNHLDDLFENLPDVLDVDEVATLLRLKKAVVYDWLTRPAIDTGKPRLPGYKLGGSWRVLREDLRVAVKEAFNQHISIKEDDSD